MAPFLSIVIPTLNEEKFLPNLLTDLQNQTEQDFEVIVVDAHSDDKTCEKAQQFVTDINLTIIQSKKRHLAYQRNIGAESASGEYVVFLDADMHIEPSFLKQLKTYIDTYRYMIYLPVHKPHDAEYVDDLLYAVMGVFTEASHMTNKPFGYGPGAVFQKDFFRHLGGYDEEVFVYEDHEIIQRARKQGVKAKTMVHNPVYFSFRRFKSEGRMKLLSKYTLATLHLLAYGKVDKEIFSYEMGGSAQYLLKQRKHFDITKVMKQFENLRKLLDE